MQLSNILTSKTPYSTSQFKLMKTRSDGRIDPKDGGVKGSPKPKTPTDNKIHLGHIVGSGQYNLDHAHDHLEELAFDYKRLKKDMPTEAGTLQLQTIKILGPIYSKMGLKLEKAS